MVPLPGMQQTKFMSQHTFDERDAKEKAVSLEPKPCTLDGFRLLDVCQVEFPDQARHVDVGGLNAVKVVTEDLAFFSNLVSIDAGRNALPFEPMAAFPNLQSLKMPCNGIRELGGGGTGLSGLFTQLTHLDLSYNMLGSPKNLTELSVLPNLRVLDLTCNGMKTLPPPEELQGGFRRLARLVLERNQIEDPGVLVSCAGLPRLEELHLGYNYLQTVAPEATDPGPSLPWCRYRSASTTSAARRRWGPWPSCASWRCSCSTGTRCWGPPWRPHGRPHHVVRS